jgi:hypothetical protein
MLQYGVVYITSFTGWLWRLLLVGLGCVVYHHVALYKKARRPMDVGDLYWRSLLLVYYSIKINETISETSCYMMTSVDAILL